MDPESALVIRTIGAGLLGMSVPIRVAQIRCGNSVHLFDLVNLMITAGVVLVVAAG